MMLNLGNDLYIDTDQVESVQVHAKEGATAIMEWGDVVQLDDAQVTRVLDAMQAEAKAKRDRIQHTGMITTVRPVGPQE